MDIRRKSNIIVLHFRHMVLCVTDFSYCTFSTIGSHFENIFRVGVGR